MLRYVCLKEHDCPGSAELIEIRADQFGNEATEAWGREQMRIRGRVPGHSWQIIEATDLVDALIQSARVRF